MSRVKIFNNKKNHERLLKFTIFYPLLGKLPSQKYQKEKFETKALPCFFLKKHNI